MAQLIPLKRVKASSLLEVIVSMVIIIIVLGTCLAIFGNVMQHSSSARQLRAQQILSDQFVAFRRNEAGDTKSLPNGWFVEQHRQVYEEESGLYWVKLSVYDENHQLLREASQIMVIQEDVK